MKICVVGDVHFSQYSSIIRRRGDEYSIRLENLIMSINWAEEQAIDNNCDKIIYLGDFFDRPDLNAEEITALSKIKWSNIPHTFIVGNHESNVSSLKFNALNTLRHIGEVIDELKIDHENKLIYIPYTLEENRKEFNEYLDNIKDGIIFSHNDIKGIQYGGFLSKIGFNVEDIRDNCRLFINGHLHNGAWVEEDKILNLGNLTGQNFSEDGSKYLHRIMILDYDESNIKYNFIVNPFAFNFFKLEINNKNDLNLLTTIPKLNYKNRVISLKCNESLLEDAKNLLLKNPDVCEYKIVLTRDESNNFEDITLELNNIDHLKQFQDFILERQEDIGDLNIVKMELMEVCN